MRILRWLTIAALVVWVGVVVMTASAPLSASQQVQAQAKPDKPGGGNGGGGGGGDTVTALELIFHDEADLDNDGDVDPVSLLSDGLERDANGNLVIAAGTDIRYADRLLAQGDPYISSKGGDRILDFDDDPVTGSNGASAADPANARTFTLLFADDGCVCQTLNLPVVAGQCAFTTDYSDPLRNPRIFSGLFRGKKAGISIKFKLSGPNGNQWEVNSAADNLGVSGSGDQRTLTATSQEFVLHRVGGGAFDPGTQCSGFTMPMQITFIRSEVAVQ